MIPEKITLNSPKENYQAILSVECRDEEKLKQIYEEIISIDGLSEDRVSYYENDNGTQFSLNYIGPCFVDTNSLSFMDSLKGVGHVVTEVGFKE